MDREVPIDPASHNLSEVNVRRSSGGVVFGSALYAAGGNCGPRVQPDYQLVAMVRAGGGVDVDGRRLEVPNNHVALMTPGKLEIFHFHPARPTLHTWCSVSPPLVSPELATDLAACPPVLPLSARMESLIAIGLGLPSDEPESAKQLLDHLGMACLLTFLSEAESRQPELPEIVLRARRLIERNLHKDLSISVLAREVGVSQQHLIRLFRKHLGVTPSRYLWQTRTRRGVELLRETGLSVGETADRLGFKSPFHFSRLVRQAYGASPREIREKAWASAQASTDRG